MFFGLFGRKKQMKREIVVNAETLETRVAILENGKLEEFMIERPTEERVVGSIYLGRVQSLGEGLRAAFIDIGQQKNAFIHYWDMIPEDAGRLEAEDGGGRAGSRRKDVSHQEISRMFPVGSKIVVQVTKGPIGTKGPRVTANLSIPGRYLVLLPGSQLRGISRKIEDPAERLRLKKVLARLPLPENTGLIVRTVAGNVSQRCIVRDMRSLLVSWQELQRRITEGPVPGCVYEEPDLVDRVVRDWLTEDVDRIVVDAKDKFEAVRKVAAAFGRRVRSRIQQYDGEAPIFDHFDVERQLEESMSRRVSLKSGGYIILEETEALTSIDVNTGRHKAKSQEETILEVNLEAVEEVARQLRLRNMGGLVMIDLIDMVSRKHQNAVFRAFKDFLARDKARTNILPISKLGILEMSRQRVEESIMAAMYGDCPHCAGRGRIKSALTMSVEIQRHIAAVLRKRRGDRGSLKLQIVVHPSILERLREEDEEILVALESKFGCHLIFKSNPGMHHESFSVMNADTGEVLSSVERHQH
ncbi:MAG: Rne/Rng family ribonuclease [bacterium]